MNLKGKSSDWGPHKGYIPVLQKFSKIWNLYGDNISKRDSQIIAFSKKTKKQLASEPEMVVRSPLLITLPCGDEFQVYVDTNLNDAQSSVFLVPTQQENENIYQWTMENDGKCPQSIDQVSVNPSTLLPLEVMSKPRETDTIYYTADYDLLAIGFYNSALDGLEDDPYDIPTLTNFNPEKGLITDKQVFLLDQLNDKVRIKGMYLGGDVSHHGPENQFYILSNKKEGSPYVDYPITAFYKEGGKGVIKAIPKGPAHYRDIYLKRFMADKRREGYNLYENIHSPGWAWSHHRKYNALKGWADRDDPNLSDSPEEIPFPEDCPCSNSQNPNKLKKSPNNLEKLDLSSISKVFPNPASQILNIFPDQRQVLVRVALSNNLGNQIIQFDQTKSSAEKLIQLNISEVPPGVYIITLYFEDNIESFPISIIN
jgi:hypothetical protein